MNTLQFAHISDTHFLRDYQHSNLISGLVSDGKTPTDMLRMLAKEIYSGCPELDFVVVSGDLVHEGKTEDYAAYHALLTDAFQDIPVHCCLGNHDRTAAFRAGYLGEPAAEGGAKEYYYTAVHPQSGLQIVVLDSSYDNSGIGMVSEEQLNWLDEVLAAPSAAGRLLVLHHPPCLAAEGHNSDHSLANSLRLQAVIEGSDIIGILSGHTHQACAATFAGIPHITADSTAFGVKLTGEYMEMNNKVGYTLHSIENDAIAASVYQMPQSVKSSFKISVAEIMKMMEARSA